MIITYEDFSKVDLRSGTIINVENFEESIKPSYKIWADFGFEIGVIQTAVKLTVNYSIQSLIGKRILGCVNLKEKNISGFISQFLLLTISDKSGALSLITFDGKVDDGVRIQ